MVGTREGVWRTRSIRRKPIGDRWSRNNIDLIVGVPWLPNPGEGGGAEAGVVLSKPRQRRFLFTLRNGKVRWT